MEKSRNKVLTNVFFVALTAMFCCALWGSATPFIKIGYELILPERNIPSTILFAGVRFFSAGVITVLIYSIARRKFLFPQKGNFDAVAYSLWGVLLKYNPVSKVSIYSFMTPVFGVLLSNLMLTEKSNVPLLNLIFALILICVGITILNYRKDTK